MFSRSVTQRSAFLPEAQFVDCSLALRSFPCRQQIHPARSAFGYWKRIKRTKKWQEYYCQDSIKLVQELYEEDFERLATYYDRDFNSTRRTNMA